MMNVTTKTKKPFMIMAAVERGLFAKNEDAAKLSCDELYKQIKAYDASANEQQVSEEPKVKEIVAEQAEQVADESKVVPIDSKKGNANKKRLPKRTKGDDLKVVEEPKVEVKVEEQKQTVVSESDPKMDVPTVEQVEYKDIQPFRTMMLSLFRTRFGVNYSSLKGSYLKKQDYTRAIGFLNNAIEIAMEQLGKDTEAEIMVYIIDKDGKERMEKLYLHRDMLAEVEDEDEDQSKSEPEPKVVAESKQKPKAEVAKMEPKVEVEQSDEERKIADQILASFGALNAELEIVRKENEALKAENNKLKSTASNAKRHESSVHDSLIDLMNKVANTKDEKYIWVWKELKMFANMLCGNDKSPIMLDIEKLIIEETVRRKNEADAQKAFEEKRAKAMEEESMYDGVNISYIDGELVKPDGAKKKKFNTYKAWADSSISYVDYVLEQLLDFDKIVIINKRKKAVKGLIAELKEWYSDWEGAFDDGAEEVIEMITNTMDELMVDRNREKAISDMVAIIDELEL